MELLYLYIQEFRNLKKLEFNFSRTHTFSFDQENISIEVVSNSGTLRDFFGEQIMNVTGVIGENGSGKSNLLELITILTRTDKNFTSNYILIYQQRQSKTNYKFLTKTNLTHLKTPSNKFVLTEAKKAIPDLSVVFFSNVADGRNRMFGDDVIDLSQSKSRWGNEKDYNQAKFLFSDYAKLVDIQPPNGILISPRINTINFSSQKVLEDSFPAYREIKSLLLKPRKRIPPPELFRYSLRFSLLSFVVEKMLGSRRNQEYEHDLFLDDQQKLTNLSNECFPENILSDIDATHVAMEKFITHVVYTYLNRVEISQFDASLLLEFDNFIERLNIDFSEEMLPKRPYSNFYIPLTTSTRGILRHFSAIFNYPGMINIEWSGISSGHKAFLNLFSQLHSAIRRISQHDNVLICIDEGDLYLHPTWQKEFLNRVIKFVPEIFKKKLQFILTTHSPFLVSDLPRENLILLQPKDEYSRIVERTETMERTFGANIIDLFLGPFFLDKGTISNFSLEKIRKAINIALNKNSTRAELNEAKEIASIIGDDMIKNKLETMLENATNHK